MRETYGLACRLTLLSFAVFCILILGLFSQPEAYEDAHPPSPDLLGCGICMPCDGEDEASCRAAYWWCPDRRDFEWTCPRCGLQGNIALAEKCIRCTYSRYNPDGYLLRPVETRLITNGYSKGHRAVDFGSRRGSPVFAVEDGIVIEVRRDKWAGNVLKIQHSGGLQTLYGHLQESFAVLGSPVRRGDVIALSGNTGRSTGPHLHFEIYLDGAMENPLDYITPWK